MFKLLEKIIDFIKSTLQNGSDEKIQESTSEENINSEDVEQVEEDMELSAINTLSQGLSSSHSNTIGRSR